MKRGLIFLFLVFFCFLSCSDYSKTSWKSPGIFTEFTSSTSPAPMLKFQQTRTLRERNRVRSEMIAEDDGLLWARTYKVGRDDYVYSLQQTSDGGYIVGGMAWGLDDNNQNNFVVLKLDSEGLPEWQKTYGGDETDGWMSVYIEKTSDGGYIVAGDTYSAGSGSSDALILKLSSNGNIQWQKTYGGAKYDDVRGDIQQTIDGGYIVIGTFQQRRGYTDVWVLKLRPNGEVEWQKTYGDHGYQYGDSIQQTADGGYIVGCSDREKSFDGKVNPWILKLSSEGEIEWQRTYLGHNRDSSFFCKIQQTSDGGYIVADHTDVGGAGQNDFWILKLKPKGNIEWQKTYGGSGNDEARRIQQTSDGGYIVEGYTDSFGAGEINCWVLKLRPNGNIQWQKIYGSGDFTDVAFAIQQTADKGYVIGGYKNKNTSVMLVFKTDKNGNISEGSDWVRNSNASVRNTSAVPSDTNRVPMDPDAQAMNSNLPGRSIGVELEIISWNLNQPPTNISLTKKMNRSLFRQEFFNIIRWEPNPYNSEFEITEYRIYRVWAGKYDLIGTVPASVFEYPATDPISKNGPTNSYAVSSVDSQGNESPKSQTVES